MPNSDAATADTATAAAATAPGIHYYPNGTPYRINRDGTRGPRMKFTTPAQARSCRLRKARRERDARSRKRERERGRERDAATADAATAEAATAEAATAEATAPGIAAPATSAPGIHYYDGGYHDHDHDHDPEVIARRAIRLVEFQQRFIFLMSTMEKARATAGDRLTHQ